MRLYREYLTTHAGIPFRRKSLKIICRSILASKSSNPLTAGSNPDKAAADKDYSLHFYENFFPRSQTTLHYLIMQDWKSSKK